MTIKTSFSKHFDPALDLVLERIVPVPAEKVWAAWTQPRLLKKWFAPRPWTTPEIELDLQPGGLFRSVMQSPQGEQFPSVGCVLLAEPGTCFAWTNALGPGFRPSSSGARFADALLFTAIISIKSVRAGAKYTAIARHQDVAMRAKHAGIGFHEGWGTCLDQLVALMSAR